MRAFSLDLRERVLADFQAGATFAELGRKYRTSAEWVRQFIRRFEMTGEIEARPPIIKKLPFHKRHEAEIRQAVAEDSSLTLESLRQKLGLQVSIGTLWTALHALKISFKKRPSLPLSKTVPMSPRNVKSSKSGSKRLTQTASFSSTKPGSKPT
jgi:transposase